jgi:hypothetical protein
MGGLGNQLFQIFTTIAYSLKYKVPFKFLELSQLGGGSTTIRYTYWNSFFRSLTLFLVNNLPANMIVIRENGFPYEFLPINKHLHQDIMIFGYFQSYKYFQEYYPVICRLIGLGKMKDALVEKLNFNENYFTDKISMHFRFGDYKKAQQFHPLLTHTYYFNSLHKIQKLIPNQIFTILYFHEDEDTEDVMKIIDALKLQFPTFFFERGENTLTDWEQLLLMSCCHHNIIANSSFSYFGAYFNSHEDKIVIYPSIWFGPACNNNTKDLCPPNWVKISI